MPVEFSPIDANRTRDVLQAVLTGIDEIDRHLALHLPPCVFGDRNAARFGDAFDPRHNVNAVAKDIALDDDIADVDPDAEAERINSESVAWRSRNCRWISTAQVTALTALANSTSAPSPMSLTTRPE